MIVVYFRASYDIQVEPDYFTDALHQVNQKIQLVIPGPPDSPDIFLKSVSPEEFVIEWGEPRLFGGVKVRGYQVSVNIKELLLNNSVIWSTEELNGLRIL